MRAEHVKVLDVERPAPTGDRVVDLPVVVEQGHALLGDFLAREVVGFELNGRGELRDRRGWAIAIVGVLWAGGRVDAAGCRPGRYGWTGSNGAGSGPTGRCAYASGGAAGPAEDAAKGAQE